MFSLRSMTAMALTLLASACGGGDSPATEPAPSGLAYPAPAAFTVGTAIAALTPTVTGTVTSYAVAPALPAGLALNSTSGVVSGTPTAPKASTSHTITASNSGGTTTATVTIRVNDIAPSVSYPKSSYMLTIDQPSSIAPVSSGGGVVGWVVNPALPPGLSLNTTTGAISGTPTVAGAAVNYIVTATNTGGSATFNLSIGVAPSIIFDFGHSGPVTNIQSSGSRILSVDWGYRVILWNSQTGEKVLSVTPACDQTCYMGALVGSLAGNTVAVRTPAGFDLYAATDGASRAQIDAPSAFSNFWKLASDGSYLVLWSNTRLAVWTNTGVLLFTRGGDFELAQIHAAPGEIRIANGPAGRNVIETLAVPGGSSVVTPSFSGVFNNWFGDGERFITSVGKTVLIYSRLAVQQDIFAVPRVYGPQGYGNLFWTQSGDQLLFYTIGASSTPVATYPLNAGAPTVILSGATVCFPAPGSTPALSIVDVSGTAPSKQDFPAPDSSLYSFAALSTSDWAFGVASGAMWGELNAGAPQLYSFGYPIAVAGSSARYSVGTAAGWILNFDAATRTLENQINFLSGKLQLSADGTVLAAGIGNPTSSLRVFSLPSRNVILDVAPTLPSGESPFDFDMSSNGSIILQSSSTGSGISAVYSHRLIGTSSTPATIQPLVNIHEPRVRLSPSGLLVAASTIRDPRSSFLTNSATNIYNQGVLTGAAYGSVVEWLDDSRVFLTQYYQPRGVPQYEATILVNPSGQIVATPNLPELDRFQYLGNDLIYIGYTPSAFRPSQIVNVTTAAVVWSSPNYDPKRYSPGAVAGDFVFYDDQGILRAEPH